MQSWLGESEESRKSNNTPGYFAVGMSRMAPTRRPAFVVLITDLELSSDVSGRHLPANLPPAATGPSTRQRDRRRCPGSGRGVVRQTKNMRCGKRVVTKRSIPQTGSDDLREPRGRIFLKGGTLSCTKVYPTHLVWESIVDSLVSANMTRYQYSKGGLSQLFKSAERSRHGTAQDTAQRQQHGTHGSTNLL